MIDAKLANTLMFGIESVFPSHWCKALLAVEAENPNYQSSLFGLAHLKELLELKASTNWDIILVQ